MDNIIIGVTARDENIEGDIYQVVPKNILKHLHNKASYIALINYDNNYIDPSILNMCDAIIIAGGTKINNYHYQIVEYSINNKIPLLGICMGHQVIGLYSSKSSEEDLIKIDGHNDKNLTHEVITSDGSIINRLYGDKIIVNSRHKYALKNIGKPFKPVAKSPDGIIEAIENTSDGNYILSLQWHPEDMIEMDKVFIDFVREALVRKINKTSSLN